MTADLPRRAAAEMRKRAEAATAGRWEVEDWPPTANRWQVYSTRGQGTIATDLDRADAEHVASWHPAVALAVAVLLEQNARVREYADIRGAVLAAEMAVVAEQLARAYLGDMS